MPEQQNLEDCMCMHDRWPQAEDGLGLLVEEHGTLSLVVEVLEMVAVRTAADIWWHHANCTVL